MCRELKGHKTIIGFLAMALLSGLGGCVSDGSLLPPPPSEQVKAQLGTVGVASARFTPKWKFPPHSHVRQPVDRLTASGKAAVGSFVKTAEVLFSLPGGGGGGGGTSCDGPVCGMVVLSALAVLPTFAAVVDGVRELLIGMEPITGARDTETAIRNVLGKLKIQETLRDRVLREAKGQTQRPLVLVGDQGPARPNDTVSYRSPPDRNVDTVLELSVLTIGMEGEERANPSVALVMTARARLIRIKDNAVLYDEVFEHRSDERAYAEWVVDNALQFRREFERAYQSLAEKIVTVLP
jgi:hypothetical protein